MGILGHSQWGLKGKKGGGGGNRDCVIPLGRIVFPMENKASPHPGLPLGALQERIHEDTEGGISPLLVQHPIPEPPCVLTPGIPPRTHTSRGHPAGRNVPSSSTGTLSRVPRAQPPMQPRPGAAGAMRTEEPRRVPPIKSQPHAPGDPRSFIAPLGEAGTHRGGSQCRSVGLGVGRGGSTNTELRQSTRGEPGSRARVRRTEDLDLGGASGWASSSWDGLEGGRWREAL